MTKQSKNSTAKAENLPKQLNLLEQELAQEEKVEPTVEPKTNLKSAPVKKDLNKKEVREALHGEHNSRGRGRSEAEKREP